MDTSPVGWSATIVAIIAAFLGVLIAFGVPITEEMKIALLTFFGTAAPVVVWLMSRRKVTPLADPKDSTGEELVRRVDQQPPLQAQRHRSMQRP